jgi:hypothetical protein
MVPLLLEGGLRYLGKIIPPSAQTERWGDAGPVRTLLGGEHSPAAFLLVHPYTL